MHHRGALFCNTTVVWFTFISIAPLTYCTPLFGILFQGGVFYCESFTSGSSIELNFFCNDAGICPVADSVFYLRANVTTLGKLVLVVIKAFWVYSSTFCIAHHPQATPDFSMLHARRKRGGFRNGLGIQDEASNSYILVKLTISTCRYWWRVFLWQYQQNSSQQFSALRDGKSHHWR